METNTFKKYIRLFLVTLISAYLLAAIGLYFFQNHLLFAAAEQDFNHCPKLKEQGFYPVTTNTGHQTIRYYEKQAIHPQATVIFFHGKTGSACSREGLFRGMPSDLSVNWIILEYPGFSNSKETFTKESLEAYVDEALREVSTQHEGLPIVSFGASLGTTFAAQVAARFPNKVRALILQTPYLSILDLASKKYPFFPVQWILKYDFRPVDFLPKIRQNVLIYHSQDDDTIPFEQSVELKRNLIHANTQFEIFNGIGHVFYYKKDPSRFYPMIKDFIVSQFLIAGK